MKKIKLLIFSILVFFISLTFVDAAGSAYISVNKDTIENGSSVTATVTMSNAAAWNITITSSGATNGCTQKFADATSDGNNTTKYFSVTCKSTSTGIINFVMSGDITSSDGVNSTISGSKAVTVTVPRAKSTNNKLKSLSVEGYEISPSFDADVNEYTVNVPSTETKIVINATKADGYASLTGTGEKEIEEGVNTFEVVVTSETGNKNTYKLIVNVEDQNPIEVDVDGKKYTLVKVAKNLVKPELFEETTIKINDVEIPAFKNSSSGFTLVGLKDESGKISLFVYDDGEYTKYNEYKSDSLFVVFIDIDKIPSNYIKTNITINDEKVIGYKLKGDSRILVYGLNLATGKKNYYTYDRDEKTLQVFDIENYETNVKENRVNEYMIYGLSIGVLLLLLLVILLITKCSKLKKLVLLAKMTTVETKDEVSKEKKQTKKSNNEEDELKEIVEEDPYNILSDKKKRKKKK